MEIIRYINNQKLESANMSKYIIESDIILKTIAGVNQRLSEFSTKDISAEKHVEIC